MDEMKSMPVTFTEKRHKKLLHRKVDTGETINAYINRLIDLDEKKGRKK